MLGQKLKLHCKRESIDSVVNYLTSLLDEVIENENLPGVINYIYTEQGRITMPVAMALSKILVYAASRCLMEIQILVN